MAVLWLSCLSDGQRHMFTRLPPLRVRVKGRDDATELYWQPGDPFAHLTGLCPMSIRTIFKVRLAPLHSVQVDVTSEVLGIPKLVETEPTK